MKTYIYRHYHKKTLLYIGISTDPKRRLNEHKDKRWYKYITKVTLSKSYGRVKALQMEEKAIKSENPLYNKTHNNRSTLRIIQFERSVKNPNEKVNNVLTYIAWILAIILGIYLGV